MASEYLHMDNTINFVLMVEHYGWNVNGITVERDKNVGACKAEVLCRIFVIVQTAIILVLGTVRQAVRAVTFTITGILTLNWQHLKFALKDYVSIVVNLLALPILGIIAVFSPAHASQLARKLVGNVSHLKCEDTNSDNRLIEPITYIMQPLQGGKCFIATAILRITGTVQAVTTLVQSFLRALFTFEVGCLSFAFPLILMAGIFGPLLRYERSGDCMPAAWVHGFHHV